MLRLSTRFRSANDPRLVLVSASPRLPLKFVNFQNVANITVFIEENDGAEQSALSGAMQLLQPV